MKPKLLAVIIILAALVIEITSVWNDAPIVDEVPHIGAGYSYIVEQSYRFNPEHPPLVKDVAGLGLLTLPIDTSILNQHYDGNWPTDVHGQWNFGRALIFHSSVDAKTIVHAAKIPVLIFFVIAAVLIFMWASALYGTLGGLLALFLFSFAPTIIAHSRFVTTDMGALAGVIAATYFFIRYLKNQSLKNLWVAGVIFGLAQLTKFSVILIVPYVLVLGLVWGFLARSIFRTLWRSALVMIIGFIVVVGPIYQLHLVNYGGAQQQADAKTILQTYGNRTLADPLIWASDKPVLRPLAQYGLGLLMVVQRNAGGNQIYYLGEVATKAYKSYFPVVYGLKEPIPFLILLVIAIWGLAISGRSRQVHIRDWLANHFDELALLLWIVIYWTTSIRANLNIGIRHLIPVYGFTYILVAGQIILLGRMILKRYGHKARRGYGVVVYGLLIWFLVESLSVFPYYLSYFNEFAGGPSGGHRYVVDSNLDWGQDLKRLGDWVHSNNILKISLDYFGWADQEYYLGKTFVWIQGGQYTSREQFLVDNPTGGYIAVSAGYYQQSVGGDHHYSWLTQYEPLTIIGNSIFVWYIPAPYALQ